MINLLTLFSGIGAPEKALTNLNINFNLVGFSEIDKPAIKSYIKIHGVPEEKNFGDINNYADWDIKEKIDLIVYGFPCQDISLSGHCKGLFNNDGSLTRSGLFFKALGVIEKHKPKVAIAENVKNLTSKKFKEQFEIVLNSLDAAGYNNYWKILNAADFGVPQKRERVFIVSIRKDVDNGLFEFPEPFPLEKRLKDVLENEVDEKYYLNENKISHLAQFIKTEINDYPIVCECRTDEGIRYFKDNICGTLRTIGGGGGNKIVIEKPDNKKILVVGNYSPSNHEASRIVDPEGIAPTVKENHGTVTAIITKKNVNDVSPRRICGVWDKDGEKHQAGSIFDANYVSPTLDTAQGGGRVPMIVVKTNNSKGFDIAKDGDYLNISQPNSKTRRGRVGHEICQTLDTSANSHCAVVSRKNEIRIRKLTPKESFRLMGFDDESFERAAQINSNTQLYKQSGNSIVVDVMEELFCQIFDENGEIWV